MRSSPLALAACLFTLAACKADSAPEPKKDPSPATASAAPAPEGALHLGAMIEPNAQKVALTDVAKSPDAFVGKTFTTTGTVTAVCQHMGCWMEIKDEAGEAHVKMAGHGFFVPKTASGRKARVLATLVKAEEGACEGEGHDAPGKETASTAGGGEGDKKGDKKGKGCRAEAEAQLGRPLAKLELVAQGVELM